MYAHCKNDKIKLETNPNLINSLIIKFDSEGVYQWARSFESNSNITNFNITAAKNLNIVSYSENRSMEKHNCFNGLDIPKNEFFIYQLDKIHGNLKWIKPIITNFLKLEPIYNNFIQDIPPDNTSPVITIGTRPYMDITTNNNGISYMTGYFYKSVTYDNNITYTNSYYSQFMIGIDNNGKHVSTSIIGNSLQSVGDIISVDSIENLALNGYAYVPFYVNDVEYQAYWSSSFVIIFSIKFPDLIGVIIEKYRNKVNVQFNGFINVFCDINNGNKYYVSTLGELTECTTNRFFGTGYDKNTILVN